MTEIEEVFLEHRPLFCEKCDGKMIYEGNGEYSCKECGEIQLDDFGKVRICLEEHPGMSSVELSRETGVELGIVGLFLKDGRMSIPDGSRMFIRCERCGCALRHGRYCIDCTKDMANQLQGAFYENLGEKPRVNPVGNGEKARIRYQKRK